jgi:hypothetical protein
MQRIYPIAIPFLLLAIFLQSCATTGLSKRHYGNSMYVKKERQKENTQTQRADGEKKEFNVEMLTALPKRMIERVGDAVETPVAVYKVKQEQRATAKRNAAHTPISNDRNVAYAGSEIPAMHAIERHGNAQAAADVDDSVFSILLVIGIILLVLGVIALLLDVLSLGGGWVGLIVVGLLLILVAYLVF